MTTIEVRTTLKRSMYMLLLALFITVGGSASLAAATGALSQGFSTTSSDITPGTLMILKSANQNITEAATADHTSDLLGVIGNQPLVELGGGAKEVQVVVSGLTDAFVSDINGAVKAGDKITASPINGVGMKATTSTEIVGTAQTDLSKSVTGTRTVTDRTGKKQSVKIGKIAVQVNVTYYAVPQDRLGSVVPAFLLNLGSAIAGRDVSALRVLIGFIAFLIGFIIVGVMLQAAVRSGIISIGRNPLAQKALRRGLFDVSVTALGVLVITILTIYIILTS